jgi:acyl-ACP thioesterase
MMGCSLQAEVELEVGDLLIAIVQIPELSDPIIIEQAILRSVSKDFVRMEFIFFKRGDRERLQEYVRSLLSKA